MWFKKDQRKEKLFVKIAVVGMREVNARFVRRGIEKWSEMANN